MSTTNETNRAAWLLHKQQSPFTVDSAPTPTPNERQVLVRARAVAINPCDVAIQKMGWVWDEFPVIIGCDFAGEVVAVGEEVSKVKKGDRVMGFVEQGAFQLYPVVDMAAVAKLTDNISFTDGCVIPACLATAEVALFHKGALALERPQLDAKPNGKVVVVWGASSVVGSCGVQMLKAAGFEVAAVAGGHNAEYCKKLGADYTFDHKKEDVVDEICTSLKEKTFAGIFTAILDNAVTAKCAIIASKLGQDEASRVVATVLPPTMPYTEPVPEGVRVAYCQCTDVVPGSKLSVQSGMDGRYGYEVAEYIWDEWLPKALEKGVMRCLPEANVIGKGLEDVQKGVDRLQEGVSAMKIVVEIP